jgi:hypothetical protein
MQLRPHYLAESPLYDHRVRIRSIIDRCEDSLVYIKEWAEQKGWTVDVQAVERQRRESPPANQIFSVLEPYFHPQNSTNAEQKTEKEGIEIEVEY